MIVPSILPPLISTVARVEVPEEVILLKVKLDDTAVPPVEP